MSTRTWTRWAGVVAATSLVAGCGGDEVTVPTAEALGSALVVAEDVAEDVDGVWTVNAGPPDAEMPASGVVPEEFRDLLPPMEFCPGAPAAAQVAADSLRWLAFRQLDLEEDDPIELPDDRAGHLTFLQEFLTAGDPDELADTFAALRSGMEACLGEQPAGEEGPSVTETMALPEVGDERIGQRTVMEEAGGWATWHLASAVVRDGPVLMSFVVVDITGEDTEPMYTVEQIGAMVETAVARWADADAAAGPAPGWQAGGHDCSAAAASHEEQDCEQGGRRGRGGPGGSELRGRPAWQEPSGAAG
jgi:hypothetical protein